MIAAEESVSRDLTRDQRRNGELTVNSGGGSQALENNSPVADQGGVSRGGRKPTYE